MKGEIIWKRKKKRRRNPFKSNVIKILALLLVLSVIYYFGKAKAIKDFQQNQVKTITTTNQIQNQQIQDLTKQDLQKLNNVNVDSIKPEQNSLVTRGKIIPLNDQTVKFNGDDRVVVDNQNTRDGIYSVKLIKKGTDRHSYTFTRNIKLGFSGDDTIGFWIYKDPNSNLIDSSSLEISLNNNTSEYDYLTLEIPSQKLIDGWNLIKYKKADFISRGRANSKDIESISFKLNSTSDKDTSIELSSIEINNKMKPTVVLCLDGNYTENTQATFPLLKTYGFRVTNFLDNNIFTENVSKRTIQNVAQDGSVSSTEETSTIRQYTLNIDEYNKFINDGIIEVGLNGDNVTTSLVQKGSNNYDEQKSTIQKNIDALKASGLNTNIVSFKYGTDLYNQFNGQVLNDLGLQFQRIAKTGTINYFSNTINAVPQVILTDINVNEVKGYIDECILYNKAVCISTNDVVQNDRLTSDVSIQSYTEILNYLKAKVDAGQIQVVSAGQFVEQSK